MPRATWVSADATLQEDQLYGIYHLDTGCPGPPLLFEEVDRFLELGLGVTLNLHYFADKERIRQHYGTRIHYAEINCHDEPGFIAAVSQAGGTACSRRA